LLVKCITTLSKKHISWQAFITNVQPIFQNKYKALDFTNIQGERTTFVSKK